MSLYEVLNLFPRWPLVFRSFLHPLLIARDVVTPEEFFNMFSDLIILVFESTSLLGTRPIGKKFFWTFGSRLAAWIHTFMTSNSLQLEGRLSKRSNRRGQLIKQPLLWLQEKL